MLGGTGMTGMTGMTGTASFSSGTATATLKGTSATFIPQTPPGIQPARMTTEPYIDGTMAHPIEDAYWDEVGRTGSPVVDAERTFHIGPYHQLKEHDWETWQGDATERTRQLGAAAIVHRERAGQVAKEDDAWRTAVHMGEETRLLTPQSGQSRGSSRPGSRGDSRGDSRGGSRGGSRHCHRSRKVGRCGESRKRRRRRRRRRCRIRRSIIRSTSNSRIAMD